MHPATTVPGGRGGPGVRRGGRQSGRRGPLRLTGSSAIGAPVKHRSAASRISRNRHAACGLLLPGRHVAILFQDRLRPRPAALDAGMHPAAFVVLLRDPLQAPEPHRDLAPRKPLRLAFQRQQQLSVPVPRARPDRGAGNPAQTSSMAATSRSRTRRSPPSSGKTAPRGRRTGTDTPGRSIRSIRAPSARRSPSSVAPPSAASRTSGGASRVTRPSITPACVQKGASGSSA